MKNSQKGFAIPIIIAIVTLLAIGGGAYIYTTNETKVPTTGDLPEIINNVPDTNIVDNDTNQKPPVTSQPTLTTQPKDEQMVDKIEIIYPKGGETFSAGQEITVRWKISKPNHTIGITLTGYPYPSNNQYFLGNFINADIGSQLVKIPDDVKSGKYIINISTPPTIENGLEVWSKNYFTILEKNSINGNTINNSIKNLWSKLPQEIRINNKRTVKFDTESIQSSPRTEFSEITSGRYPANTLGIFERPIADENPLEYAERAISSNIKSLINEIDVAPPNTYQYTSSFYYTEEGRVSVYLRVMNYPDDSVGGYMLRVDFKEIDGVWQMIWAGDKHYCIRPYEDPRGWVQTTILCL